MDTITDQCASVVAPRDFKSLMTRLKKMRGKQESRQADCNFLSKARMNNLTERLKCLHHWFRKDLVVEQAQDAAISRSLGDWDKDTSPMPRLVTEQDLRKYSPFDIVEKTPAQLAG